MYFYSLKKLGNFKKAENKLSELIQKHNKYIEKIEVGEIYDKKYWNEEEIDEFIEV